MPDRHDPINNPSHYTDGGYETIDFIEKMQLGYHLGNVVKYISRAGKKSLDPTEDLKKAMWYLEKIIKIDLMGGTFPSDDIAQECVRYGRAKDMPFANISVLINICSNDLDSAKKELSIIIEKHLNPKPPFKLTDQQRAKALRRIFCQMQLLSNDLEWLRLDSEIRGEFKQEIGILIRRIEGFKQHAKRQTTDDIWAHIHQEMGSERLQDFNLLFDEAIQFKDISEITDALQLLIKAQTEPHEATT